MSQSRKYVKHAVPTFDRISDRSQMLVSQNTRSHKGDAKHGRPLQSPERQVDSWCHNIGVDHGCTRRLPRSALECRRLPQPTPPANTSIVPPATEPPPAAFCGFPHSISSPANGANETHLFPYWLQPRRRIQRRGHRRVYRHHIDAGECNRPGTRGAEYSE
jgi:hypothetical protein